MKRGRTHSSLILFTVCVLYGPLLARAEDPHPVGIVTAVGGQATVARAATPQPTGALKFRDPLFPRDRVTTKDQSAVRVLVGGKALLTVQESTDLSVGSDLHQPMVIYIFSGTMALAVARAKMKPGEGFEVRTPNAVATVRGTVILVEVAPPASPSQEIRAAPTQTPRVMTTFHVISGKIQVVPLAAPKTSPVSLGAGLSVTVTGESVGTPFASPPLQDINRLIVTPQHVQSPDEVKKAMRGKQGTTAEALTEAMALELAGGEEGEKKKKGTSKAKSVDPVLLDSSKGAEVIMKAPITPTTKPSPGK